MTKIASPSTCCFLLLLAALLLAPGRAAAGGNPEETKQLIAVLQSDAGQYEKGVACRKLAACGTAEAIPVLAKMLGDEKMSHLARYGLEAMPDPAAGAALREALGTLQGRLLVGVINSVAMRRDGEATAKLIELLKSSDAEVAAAAAAALGRIANAPAAAALAQTLASAADPLKNAAADASLVCAEQLEKQGKPQEAIGIYDALRAAALPVQLRQAALQGAILARGAAGAGLLVEQLEGPDRAMAVVALRAARLLPGTAVTQALAVALPKLPEENQALLVQALGDRGDAAARPALAEAAQKGAAPVRLAAVRVLGRLGDASAVPLLLQAAAQSGNELAEAAQASLAALPGTDADAAIVAALGSGDAQVRRVAIDIASQRQIQGAVPGLLAAARDPEAATRLAALAALKGMSGANDFGALVEIMVKAGTPGEAAAAQAALASALTRIGQKDACAGTLLAALPQATPATKSALLQLLAQAGGEKPLEAVRAATTDTNPQIREAALRALCERSTPDALPDLMRLSKEAPDARFKILALRGQFRVIPQMQAPADQKLTAIKDALALTERPEEKYLALAALAEIPSAGALELVTPYLSEPAMQEEAAVAAVAISQKIVKSNPAEVAAALSQVKSTNRDVTRNVRTLLAQSGAPPRANQNRAGGKKAGGKKAGGKKAGGERGFVSLFDGKTLEGWEGDPAVWSVKDGVIVGKANMIKQNNFLSTKKEYGNFILRAKVRLVDQKGNTGLQFRSIKIPNTPMMAGFQADFADVEKYCGMLYDEKRRGILVQPKPETIKLKPGAFNDLEIRARGNRIQIFLNGVQTIDYTEQQTQDPKTGQAIWPKGYLGLQTHAGKVMEVQFKNIRIRELK